MSVSPGPLHGVRIVEMDAIGPVPLAAMLLADIGADIIRIARPPGNQTWDDVGGAVLHRNRDVVHLDLKQAADRAAALDLIGRADVVLEGFRPGVMERLELGPDTCLARNPALVYARLTGWGQFGPLSARAGHDLNYIAISGVLRAMGAPDRPPPVPLNMVGDYAGGTMFAISGILAALLQVRAGGTGQVVDIAMTDCVAALSGFFLGYRASGLWSDDRGTNLLDGSAPFYRCYSCADGEYVSVGALEPQFFSQLIKGLGLPADAFVQLDRDGWPAMTERFAQIFASQSRDFWTARFGATDACVAPVLSFAEAAAHPHNVARDAFVGTGQEIAPGVAPRFSSFTPDPPRQHEPVSAENALSRWQRR
jgi:alpha-methylacyl-CoA racemase